MEINKLNELLIKGKKEREQAEIQIKVHAVNQAISTFSSLVHEREFLDQAHFKTLDSLIDTYFSIYMDAFFPKKQVDLNGSEEIKVSN